MAKRKPVLFADVMVPSQIVHKLRRLGYGVETVQQYQGTSEPEVGLDDDVVLDVATTRRRTVITLNEKHFKQLHRLAPRHSGIIICNHSTDHRRRAKEIDEAIKANSPLAGKLIYIPLRKRGGST